MSTSLRSGGIALLTALIVLAITSALAYALSADTGLAIRRTAGSAAQEQAREISAAAEALASSILRDALEDPNAAIHAAQSWARPFGPVEIIPGYVMEAEISDLEGRFNLNTLINADGRPNELARRTFERLLQNLELEPQWAAKIIDWIDLDDQPLDGGAEAVFYSGLTPGFRPANRMLTSTSELLAIEGFDLARYRRLEPHITTLPRDAGLNLCSATGALLDALSNERQWSGEEDALQRNRDSACFPKLEVFRNTLVDPNEWDALGSALGLRERSRYFGLRSYISSGRSSYTSFSLLRYEGPPSGQFRVMIRHTAP
ncbi:MAG: type II secretion system minor pseudopilin GspK [Steroidobacteraceae bacterium]|jgi:general secretion pathway protein K